VAEQRVIPFIAYEDAAEAIAWLSSAFGFEEQTDQRYTDEDGTVTHAELRLDGAMVYLATPTAEYVSPKRHRETCDTARRAFDNPYVVDGHFVHVDDVDAHYERAVAAGATILSEPAEPGYGYRVYVAEDVEGHRWMFGQPV
jgi:uncharacterized glyoxalase superfamily protein PhnB